MATSGLQRRRVAGVSTAQDEDVGGTWSSSPTLSPGASGSNSNSASSLNGLTGSGHAGTAFEGGSKIAYDPRDLELDDTDVRASGGRMPKLTIMEEVLLLGLKDKQV